tara:strand:- start:103 stop:411 length:309 start_codon:yes stop_codon:yes gene_type:complete
MRGTINFIITENRVEHVFNKASFKYMYSSYSSGSEGHVFVHFQAESDVIDHDVLRLTVKKEFISSLVSEISKKLNEFNHSEVKHSQSTGVYKQVSAITYTAG